MISGADVSKQDISQLEPSKFWQARTGELSQVRVVCDLSTRGYCVTVGDRCWVTPKGVVVNVEHQSIAECIRAELEEYQPPYRVTSLPFSGMINAALDQIAPNRPLMYERMATIMDGDMVCYRSPERDLAKNQDKHWTPLIAALADSDGRKLSVSEGFSPLEHNLDVRASVLDRLNHLSLFEVTVVAAIAEMSGSLIIALGAIGGSIDKEDTWYAMRLEEEWQRKTWGSIEDHRQLDACLRLSFDAAWKLLELERAAVANLR